MTERRTVVKGRLVMEQDITKSSGAWHPKTEPADGDAPVFDGSDALIATYWWGSGVLPTYQTRDGRRVIRFVRNYTPFGLAHHPTDIRPGWRPGSYILITAYLHLSNFYFFLEDVSVVLYATVEINLANPLSPAAGTAWSRSLDPVDGSYLTVNDIDIDTTGWTSGWYKIGMAWHKDRGLSVCVVPDLSELDWISCSDPNFLPSLTGAELHFNGVIDCTLDPDAVFDIYEIAWGLA